MFKKLLASMGMGSAKVETRLTTPSIYPGQGVQGEVYLEGGEVDQVIDSLDVVLATSYLRESGDNKYRENCDLARQVLTGRFTLAPRQRHTVPFTLQAPMETPITMGQGKVWVHTDLNIAGGMDSTDNDPVSVHPLPVMQSVFTGLESLGFHLHTTEVEYSRSAGGRYPFVQEFEFKPYGAHRATVEEVEVAFRFDHGGLTLLLEVDRRARGFSGWLDSAMDMDERRTRLHVPHEAQPPQIAGMLDDAIRRAAR